MKDLLNIFVSGEPKPQPRTRACFRGKHAGTYDPGTADGWKWLVGKSAKEECQGGVVSGPVELFVHVYFRRPQSHFGAGRNADRLKPSAPRYPTSKQLGDADNLAKAVMDAITDSGVVWIDDAQVTDLHVTKRYADLLGAQGAFVKIREVE